VAEYPQLGKVVGPSRRDMQPNQAALSQLTPERLTRIRSDAERGIVTDWVDLCFRMLSRDAHIRAEYETRVSAVSGARWALEPGSGHDPIANGYAQQACEFAEAALRDLPKFSETIADIMSGVYVGWSLQEIHWHFDRAAGAFTMRDVESVNQRRMKFGPAYEPRIIDDGTQYDSTGKPLVPNKFIYFAPSFVPGSLALTGCASPISWAFLFKSWGVSSWMSAAERFGSPLFVGRVDRNTPAEVREAFRSGLEQLSSDQVAIIEDPGAIQILDAASSAGVTQQTLVEFLNKEISKALLGSTDSSEPGSVGSYGAVESRKGTTIDARKVRDERAVSAAIEAQLLWPLMQFNAHRFGGVVPPCPKFRLVLGSETQAIAPEVVSAGVVRVNELRASAGLEPIEGPKGDEFVAAPASGGAPSDYPLAQGLQSLSLSSTQTRGAASGGTMWRYLPPIRDELSQSSEDPPSSSSKRRLT
jgi:phage gp29-like protein